MITYISIFYLLTVGKFNFNFYLCDQIYPISNHKVISLLTLNVISMTQILHRTYVCAGFIALSSLFSIRTAADTVYASHGVKTNDMVYPYTGFCTTEDVDDLTLAVKLTHDILAPLAGAKVTALHIGWAGLWQDYTPDATAFLRTELNNDNFLSTEINLASSDGWVVATFAEPYTIKENDEFFMGYTVDMKSYVYGPCTLTYGSIPEGTHFMSRPDMPLPDGSPDWIDLSTPGLMDMACPVMIIAEVEVEGEGMHDRAAITEAITPALVSLGQPATGAIKITNKGSNDISSFTVSYSQNGSETWSQDLELNGTISSGSTSLVNIPVYVAGNGESTLSISKVNGNPNGETSEYKFNALAIPSEISERFTRRPLVEYFASESEYRSADYDQNIVTPGLSEYQNLTTRIDWHIDDQFQLGLADQRDEVLDFMVDVAKGDKSLVYAPTVMVDRDINLGLPANYLFTAVPTPMIGVIYSPGAEMSYEYALAQPTFASVNVEASLENDIVTVTVSGDADTSVLPEGEDLMLTVVLVEDGVESDSQEYPGGSGEGSNPGYAVHNNLVRQRLSDIWGDASGITDGKYSATFTTELDYDNKPENMRAVAFLNRQKDNGMWERSVINSAQANLKTSGVKDVVLTPSELRPALLNNSFIAPEGCTLSVFNAAGCAVSPKSLRQGVYIVVVNDANGNSASFKMTVK